jgi:hypothetical protein
MILTTLVVCILASTSSYKQLMKKSKRQNCSPRDTCMYCTDTQREHVSLSSVISLRWGAGAPVPPYPMIPA